MENKERQIIETFTSKLPVSPYQKNKFFESDAELLSIDLNPMLFSVDTFSAEDLFCDHDPFSLGQNLTISTISDIIAAGGNPVLFAHSVQIPEHWSYNFIDKFSQGIADILKKSECGFIGGDLGVSNDWNYTGICMGKSIKNLNRMGSREGDNLYLSGEIGSGNLQAAMCLFSDYLLSKLLKKIIRPNFFLRLDESKLIRRFATTCIDTSDGLLNALNTIAELNGLGYHINNIPYLNQCQTVSKILSKSIELFFMGECGEYELLFTIPDSVEESFLKEAKNKGLKFYKIGKVKNTEEKIIEDNNKSYRFNDFDIRARNYRKVEEYLQELNQFIKQ